MEGNLVNKFEGENVKNVKFKYTVGRESFD